MKKRFTTGHLVVLLLAVSLVGVLFAKEFTIVGTRYLDVRQLMKVTDIEAYSDATTDIGTASVRINAIYTDELFVDKGDSVASAASEFTLGSDGNYYVITGTATIDSIAAQTVGKIVVLETAAACTLSDGGNLRLSADLNATADDILTLISDGTDWYEVSRSAN